MIDISTPVTYIVAKQTDLYVALTSIPTMRPNVAPTAMDGTKIPAGTFAPYEIMIRAIRSTVANRRELTILH